MQKVGIVCCSNGQKQTQKEQIDKLEKALFYMGMEPILSPYIYETMSVFSGSAKERANALMKFYEDPEMTEIFDISGGDIANGILPYLDYELIGKSSAEFWGYSDLTTIINAIYEKTGKSSVLYQIRNILYETQEQLNADFFKQVFEFSYRFVQHHEMHGIVIGGNIRCFLKLAGTEYMPDFTNKILLLESRGGTVAQMETYLSQLKQLGAFEKVSGILLGTFTQMEAEKCMPTVESMVKEIAGKDMPIAVTRQIGHGTDAKAIVIGKEIHLIEDCAKMKNQTIKNM